MVLSGLSPSLILEVANWALKFHQYQSGLQADYLRQRINHVKSRRERKEHHYGQVYHQMEQRMERLKEEIKQREERNRVFQYSGIGQNSLSGQFSGNDQNSLIGQFSGRGQNSLSGQFSGRGQNSLAGQFSGSGHREVGSRRFF